MNKFNKNFLFVIPLFFIILSCSLGNNGTASSNTDSYDFDKLIRQNVFYTPPPASICPGVPINRESGLQLPEANCNLSNPGIHSQIAYGCDVESNNPDNLGNRFSKAVVGIAIPESNTTYWHIGCTGTIIESNWILTAAHCVAFSKTGFTRGSFYPNIQNLRVIPWQLPYNGVPTGPIYESTNVTKFPVKAIYLPYHFSYYNESYLPPYPMYVKDDFVLLELESALSADYTPITVESKVLDLYQDNPLWTAGYGRNESQRVDGQLHFREIYYYSNLYNTSFYAWRVGYWSASGPSVESGANYGMIYTLGSIPESTESQPPAAWSFLGDGDSGGPLLYYNQDTQKFGLLATHIGGVYCSYAGFYAPLPYSFDQNTAITDSRYTLIEQIINKTASRAEVRCISKTNACYPRTSYVLNKGSNSVTVYNFDNNNNLHLLQTITTGANPRAFSVDQSHDYLLVANNGNTQADQGSVSVFKINLNGSLSSTSPGQFNSEINKPIDIILNSIAYIFSPYKPGIYVANNGNNSIVRLAISHDNGTLSVESAGLLTISNLSRIKFDSRILFGFATAESKIVVVDENLKILDAVTDNLNLPTDLTVNRRQHPLVVNSGNNSILNIELSIATDSHGEKPNQIIRYHDFYYVNNLASNNIAIFKDNGNESLVFTNTIPTGQEPINMMITESQLWITNLLDDSVGYYNILPDGNLEFKESAATGLEPVAVLVN